MAAPNLAARSMVAVNKVGTDDAGYNPVGHPWSHLTIVSALADLAMNYPAASATNPHVVAVGPGVFVSAAIAIPPWTFICGSCDGQGNQDTEIQLTGNITLSSGWNLNATARGGIGGMVIRASSGTPVIDFTMPAPVAGNPARTIQVWDLRHDLTQEIFEATSTADVWERVNTIQDGVNTDVITQTGGTSRLNGYNLCAAIITIKDKASFAAVGQWQGVVNTVAGSGLVANSIAAAGCTLRLTISTLRHLTLSETAPGVIAVAADAPSIPLVASITFTGTAADGDLTRLTDAGAVAGGGGVSSIAGTANQIVASAPTGAVTLSLASNLAGITSVTAPTNTELTIGTLDNNKDVNIAPNGTGNVKIGGAQRVTVTTGNIIFGTPGGGDTRLDTQGAQAIWDRTAVWYCAGGGDLGFVGVPWNNLFAANVKGAAYFVGGVAGVDGTIDATKTATVVKGIITLIV